MEQRTSKKYRTSFLMLFFCAIFLTFSCSDKSSRRSILNGNCDESQITFDFPFSYTVASDHLDLAGGIKLSLGPWGAHVMPFTGHPNGNGKADMQGLYTWTLAEQTELTPSNGNGICEASETCGIPEAQLLAKAPEYISPSNGMIVTSVKLYNTHAPGSYYSTQQQWEVQTQFCTYAITFGHVRKISADLRGKMISAGLTDPWSVTSDSTDNLITGGSITLNKGNTVAFPQIVADPVAGHAGYFSGKWSNTATPWVQMEFGTRRNEQSQPIYRWFSQTLQNSLRSIFIADVSNVASLRYGGYATTATWLWKAEADLWTREQSFMDEYGDLFTNLGGWPETSDTGSCTTGEAKCDMLLSIFPILKTSPLYDVTNYASANSNYLFLERYRATSTNNWAEVIQPSSVDPQSGTLKLRWRDYISGASVNYQAIKYRVDSGSKLLKVRWGAKSVAADQVIPPSDVSAGDTCDGTTLTCHNHEFRSGD